MANTGNVQITERDINPFSPTYNTTRVRTVQDYQRCLPEGNKWYFTLKDGNDVYTPCSLDTVISTSDTIGYYDQFYHMLNITSVAIGDCVTEIGDDAFRPMTWINGAVNTLYVPCSVQRIGNSAFKANRNLTNINICNGMIDTEAFALCTDTVSLTLGNGVTSIGASAFAGCNSLRSITIPNSCTSIGETAFYDCTSATSLTIGTGLTAITYGVFMHCTSLTSVTIPSNVTRIGGSAFSGCSNLRTVTVEKATPPALNSTAFDSTGIQAIYVPAASVGIYKNTSVWSAYASIIQAIP